MDIIISNKKIAEYREAFDIFDKDGDGFITRKDLQRVLCLLGQKPTDAQLEKMFREVDVDGMGRVEFPQFLDMMKETVNDFECCIVDSFKIFDEDEDGFISLDDLKSIMSRLGERLSEKQLEDMISQADTDSAGKVRLADLAKVMDLKLTHTNLPH